MAIVIGDIAGQYDALIRLVSKLPKGETIILVGDLIDRGPKSRQVVEWAMTTPGVLTIKGNHEDMFVDFYRNQQNYDYGLFQENGGTKTLRSYGASDYATAQEAKIDIPEDHITWLESLPYYIEEDAFLISHAPFPAWDSPQNIKKRISNGDTKAMDDVMWNRSEPADIPDIIQVFGHNASWGLKWFSKGETKYAICLDDSHKDKLTAFDTKTLEIYQEPYKEMENGTDSSR